MTPPKKRKKRRARNSFGLLFAAFILIAISIVVLLEYLDYQKGKPSFIFTKIIPLETRVSPPERLNGKLLQLLNEKKIKYDYFKDSGEKYHFKLEIGSTAHLSLVEEIKKIVPPPRFTVEVAEIQKLSRQTIYLYNIKYQRKITHILLMAIAKATSPRVEKTQETREKRVVGSPKIAFIIDDIGYSDLGAAELKDLGIPITASIIPHAPYAFDEARQIQMYGLEAMIHLPMQRINSGTKGYNSNHAITADSSDLDIKNLVTRARQIIPYAGGVNNHEGSLITPNKVIMEKILRVIKGEGLFFVDSRTTARTVAYATAKRLHVKTAERDEFLDKTNGTTYRFSLRQIDKLIEKAKRKGKAIAIGHPHSTTLKAIKDSVRRIRSEGIQIVFVSKLVE